MAEDFTSEKYVDPSSATEGINGGKQFVGSDALFADDINKIVNNEMYLKSSKTDVGHRHVYEDLSGVAEANHTHNAKDLDFNPAEVGAVEANEEITGDTKCKITYDHKGLVTKGENLAPSDIPAGLITGSNGITVSRSGNGVYTVGGFVSKLTGYRYSRQTISSSTTMNFNSYDLTKNRVKGAIQVLFLRLNQSQSGYTIDIPIEMLLLMYQTQQELEVLGSYSDVIKMQITSCSVSRYSASHPYMDIALTVKFSYSSRSGTRGNGLRAEWWGRTLEATSETSGY